jgi:hypothetical protein
VEYGYRPKIKGRRKEKVKTFLSFSLFRVLENANEEFGRAEISRQYEKELLSKKRFGDDMIKVIEVKLYYSLLMLERR